ncbi:hypothetical protein SteCoe_6501 [Stentor coeruleus]|uniref:Casein kinase I n=1 Tax=Stentor coeruleus TaxID=5963 RepID=A0A1R2CPV1_9CILI|nr:hypothetical protein SteCoe_6501 [Stentor coeruleus]
MSFPKRIQQYSIEKVLGVGGYGQVFLASTTKTSEKIAVKVSHDRQSLMKEYGLLKHLSKLDGFMKVYEYGELEEEDFFVAELLGKNLSYNFNDRILSFECVCAIGLELLNKIEKMHENDVIHRDIKPSQFLISTDKKSIYLVDFGMACFFRVKGNNKEFKTRRKCRGTVSYASINNHLGFRQSRRDDLESLCYSLLYLVRGGLPWKLEKRIEGFKKWKLVLNQKINISDKELFGNLPPEFSVMLKYTRKLCYDQTPNYAYMKSLLGKFLVSDKIWCYFDWLDSPDKPFMQKRNSQIVAGATIVTKLKREKKVYQVHTKKRKTTTATKSILRYKVLNIAGSLDSIGSEKISVKNRISAAIKTRKQNLSGSNNQISNASESSIGYFKNAQLNEEMGDFKLKKFKTKKTMKLYKVLSALDLDKAEENVNLKTNNAYYSNSLLPSGSGLLQDTSNECNTPRLELPEFKNRELILRARKKFADELYANKCVLI